MTSDGLMNYWIYEALNAQAMKMNSSVFFYEFAYEGTFTSTYSYQYPQRYGNYFTSKIYSLCLCTY